jgi:hypothetical protein
VKKTRRPAYVLAALLATCALVLVACGDDDDSDTSTTDDSTAEAGGSDETEEAAASDEDLAFCEAITSVDAASGAAGPDNPPDPEVMAAAAEEVEANAPDALADEVPLLLEAIASTDGSTPEGFEAAYAATQDFQVETCGYAEVEGSAIDYAYQDLPTEIEAGPTVIRLDNTGSATEFHELVLLRVNDDVEETTEELLALPEEEALSKVTTAGVAFAPLGTTAGVSADLDAGRYIAVCFLPVGSTPEAFEAGGPPDGPPHMLEGMVQDITVS